MKPNAKMKFQSWKTTDEEERGHSEAVWWLEFGIIFGVKAIANDN